MGREKKFFFFATGIFISFFFYGIFQEKITKTKYVNPDESVEVFTYSMSLVLLYCAGNYILTLISLKVTKQEDTTPSYYYYPLGVLYLLAMVCSIMALQFVSYPTQVIAKSCKPIPVMICGVLLGKKSYSFKKYIFVLLIVIGITLFFYKESKEEKSVKENQGFGIGEILLLSSLLMDGLYSAMQEKMKAEYQTKPLPMMGELNKWATVHLLIIVTISKEIFSFISFIQRQPSVIWKLGALSVFGFIGQFFIISTVVEFGTLPASLVATVRKFVTVLVSVIVLGNSLQPRQWLGTIVLFSGLVLDALYGKTDTKSK